MRLKTKVINAGLLIKMAVSVEKMAKRWIWHFSPDYIHFIVGKQDISTTMQMFGQIKADRMFEEYVVESGFGNNIWIELTGEHLVRALKSSQQASNVAMRLTKKEGLPVLALSITNTSRTGNCVFLSQDIPVRPLKWQEAEDLKQPVMMDYQVHILLPPLTDVRTIAERMRPLGNHITVSANMAGDFLLKVETDAVRVETTFSGLVNPELDPGHCDVSQQPSLSRDRQSLAHVRVDIRDFVKFLHSSVINPRNVVCCLFEGQGLILYVYLGEGTDADDGAFVYYVPMRSQ
ncbi:uncharacterized protein SPPG_07303 [Spizellomyces punctatus DAOM BR117]|uniref:Checkpoint protein n=1 Tax=Spizellomyces punctatus (strain DAOM BR117) TaxID=645134 RepID=A0A0L0H8Q7_SPIPD|nr:uncharacterized protein SPPG_07303 [Spizellomyces punctatus DAOM BR117]KNC97376.1 hypothetical protein SPPG_07303 [Spizellomyces punctatus DAOM BR117]|eukprot:XP_016605416.1 hypothetical protein SPPG_07303 [Spizellomyces punctatus DAOM BR117]